MDLFMEMNRGCGEAVIGAVNRLFVLLVGHG
jgi:hypothetical protein